MNGWWLSEARRIGGEIRGFSPKAGTRVSSCRSFWSEKSTRFPPSIAIESLKPLVWPESGSGFASNHWFGPNRGRVLLQTTWFDPNRGRVLLQTTWFDPNRGSVLLQTTWFGPNRGRFCIKPPGLAPIAGRFWIKPPGLAPIGVGFASNHLVWPQSGSGFASKAIPILGLVRAESKDPAPARGGTGS